MSTADPWAEFESSKVKVRYNTVDKLKQIITGFNEVCCTVLSKSGKKQELIDRVLGILDGWKNTGNIDRWNAGRIVLNQVRDTGMFKAAGSSYAPPPIANPPKYMPGSAASVYSVSSAGSSIPRYDSFSTLRNPSSIPSPSASTSLSAARPIIRFRLSPFFHIDQLVSSVVECPESTSQADRRQQIVSFTLNNEQILKLTSSSTKYQLRLYCTSSSYYSLSPAAFRQTNALCPIEFPPTCEVRVNQNQITANMKGLKKKPGTAPPADLTKLVKMVPGASTKVEMVYVNNQTNSNQQPPPPKKYYIAVMLVQVTNVDQLIDRLVKGKYKSKTDILAKMKQAVSDDDDIVAGPQKMSLKCPLSYMRITTPCRAAQCVHPQCFDAMSWYSVNEQTTTWMCPVCDKTINHEDLIVDGYFDEILKTTPDTVEDVMVEADGEWHTSDDNYASAGWKQSHKPVAATPVSMPPSPAKPIKQSRSHSPELPPNGSAIKEGMWGPRDDDAVLVLDSDDEDEGRVKRELSPSCRDESSNLSLESAPPGSQIIDLTLDSDDEPEPPAHPSGKRKAVDEMPSPTEPIWKKSRMDTDGSLHGVMRSVNGNVNTSASTSSATGSNIGGSPYMNGSSYQRQPSASSQYPYSPHPARPWIPQHPSAFTSPLYPPNQLPPPRPTSSPRHHYYSPPTRHPYQDWR